MSVNPCECLSHNASVFLYEPASDKANVDRTLTALRRWSEIHAGHHHEVRDNARYECVLPVIVSCRIEEEDQDLAAGNWVAFVAWTRNISRTGASMVSDHQLFPFDAIVDNMPILRVDHILSEKSACVLGLPRVDACPIWTAARIVRRRPVHGGLIEMGVRFLQESPADAPDLCLACKKLLHEQWCLPGGPDLHQTIGGESLAPEPAVVQLEAKPPDAQPTA